VCVRGEEVRMNSPFAGAIDYDVQLAMPSVGALKLYRHALGARRLPAEARKFQLSEFLARAAAGVAGANADMASERASRAICAEGLALFSTQKEKNLWARA
jgi:hypothetical protein